MKKRIKIVLLFFIMSFLSGCWDRVEIEERGFVVGIGVDVKEDTKKKDKQIFNATYQFVVPVGIGGPTLGGGDEKAYMNITQQGDNMFQIGRDMSNSVARTPYYEHLQILILSEDVVKKPGNLGAVLDFFLRDHEMRRSKKVLIGQGSMKELLEFKPDVDKIPAMYIDSISENNYKTAFLLAPARIGDVQEYILEENNFVIPAIKKVNENVEIFGGAVFRGNTNAFMGYLSEEEISGLNFITSEVKGGALKAEYNDGLIVYEVQRANSNIKPIVHSPDDIEFNININAEGNIALSHTNINFSNQNEIKKMEKKLEEELEKLVIRTIEKTQKDLKVDILGLNRILEQKEYDTWQKVKNNWDRGEGRFPSSKIHVKADLKIRTTGAAAKSKNR